MPGAVPASKNPLRNGTVKQEFSFGKIRSPKTIHDCLYMHIFTITEISGNIFWTHTSSFQDRLVVRMFTSHVGDQIPVPALNEAQLLLEPDVSRILQMP